MCVWAVVKKKILLIIFCLLLNGIFLFFSLVQFMFMNIQKLFLELKILSTLLGPEEGFENRSMI